MDRPSTLGGSGHTNVLTGGGNENIETEENQALPSSLSGLRGQYSAMAMGMIGMDSTVGMGISSGGVSPTPIPEGAVPPSVGTSISRSANFGPGPSFGGNNLGGISMGFSSGAMGLGGIPGSAMPGGPDLGASYGVASSLQSPEATGARSGIGMGGMGTYGSAMLPGISGGGSLGSGLSGLSPGAVIGGSPSLLNSLAGAAINPSLDPLITGQQRKRRSKKPKDKPKRPLSAYNIFFKDERERILRSIPDESDNARENDDAEKADGKTEEDTEGNSCPLSGSDDEHRQKRQKIDKQKIPTLSVSEGNGGSNKKKKPHGKIGFENLAKTIGARWKEISPSQLEYYKAEAEKDTERYAREMDTYTQKMEEERERLGNSGTGGENFDTEDEKDGAPGLDHSIRDEAQRIVSAMSRVGYLADIPHNSTSFSHIADINAGADGDLIDVSEGGKNKNKKKEGRRARDFLLNNSLQAAQMASQQSTAAAIAMAPTYQSQLMGNVSALSNPGLLPGGMAVNGYGAMLPTPVSVQMGGSVGAMSHSNFQQNGAHLLANMYPPTQPGLLGYGSLTQQAQTIGSNLLLPGSANDNNPASNSPPQQINFPFSLQEDGQSKGSTGH